MVGFLMQPLQRLRQRLRGRIRVEADDSQQRRQEARDGGLAGLQFGVEHIVGRTHQAANFIERLGQFIAADGGIDALAQFAVWQGRIEQHPACLGQRRGGPIQILERALPDLAVFLLGLGEQFA